MSRGDVWALASAAAVVLFIGAPSMRLTRNLFKMSASVASLLVLHSCAGAEGRAVDAVVFLSDVEGDRSDGFGFVAVPSLESASRPIHESVPEHTHAWAVALDLKGPLAGDKLLRMGDGVTISTAQRGQARVVEVHIDSNIIRALLSGLDPMGMSESAASDTRECVDEIRLRVAATFNSSVIAQQVTVESPDATMVVSAGGGANAFVDVVIDTAMRAQYGRALFTWRIALP